MPFSPGEYFQRTLYNIKKIDMALKDYKIQNTIRNIFVMQFCIKYTVNLRFLKKRIKN